MQLMHLTTGGLLLVAGVLLMVFTVYLLHANPYLCLIVLAWLSFVQYAVLNAWWQDISALLTARGAHRARSGGRHE